MDILNLRNSKIKPRSFICSRSFDWNFSGCRFRTFKMLQIQRVPNHNPPVLTENSQFFITFGWFVKIKMKGITFILFVYLYYKTKIYWEISYFKLNCILLTSDKINVRGIIGQFPVRGPILKLLASLRY